MTLKGPYYKCNMTDILAAVGLVQLRSVIRAFLREEKRLLSSYDEWH